MFGAATVVAAMSGHGASLTDFAALAGSVLIGVLTVVGLKYVFRPPAIRGRYGSVFIALPIVACIGAFLLLR